MKKIGKKLSYLTKVFLVFGLLFSNLASLKVVFAYEGEGNTVISEDKEEVLEEENKEETNENTEGEELGEENKEENEVVEETTEEENKETEESEVTEGKEETTVEGEKTEEENTTEEETTSEEETTEELTEDETVEAEHDYTKELNDSAKALGLDATYKFVEGKVLVVVGVNNSEVAEIVSNAFDDVTHEIVEDEIILTDGDKTITYKVVIYNEELLSKLMKAAVGNGETTEDDDVNGDGKVDANDVVLLKQILKTGFGNEVVNQNVTIESKFDGNATDLSVGDTFTVQYVLTLSEYAVDGITGLIKYNKDMLSLDKVEVRNFDTGENYEGKFLYFGDYLRGTEKTVTDEDGNELTTYEPKDYVVIVMTFTTTAGGSDTISIENLGYFYENLYYEGNTSDSLDVNVLSTNNRLSSVTVAGQEITIDELTDNYSITVGNDVTSVDLEYLLSDTSASVSSIVAPEELAVGENTITITVVAENGEERTYTITVTREDETTNEENNEEVVAPVTYENNYNNNNYDDKKEDSKVVDKDKNEDKNKDKEDKEEKDDSKLSRVIIIILILLAIAGLIYLIFRDEDDEETKKANKDVEKLKKEEFKETDSRKDNYNKNSNKKGR